MALHTLCIKIYTHENSSKWYTIGMRKSVTQSYQLDLTKRMVLPNFQIKQIASIYFAFANLLYQI